MESLLEKRSAFLARWPWSAVVALNRDLCQRNGAKHQERHASQTSQVWEGSYLVEKSFAETLDFLRTCSQGEPFLFLNENTFAEIGRIAAQTLCAKLLALRKREILGAMSDYIEGVRDRAAMTAAVASLCRVTRLQPGDRVRTLKGSLRGKVRRVFDNGTVEWIAETGTEFTTSSESLVFDD